MPFYSRQASLGATMVGRILSAALCAVFASSLAQPEVTTSLGSIKGYVMQTISGREIHAFEGIPFAKPPIGKHRFKPAVPNGPWTGVLNATRLPNICMQQTIKEFSFGNGPVPDVIGSEDCLYLNVYKPKLTAQQPSDKLLNVIVEIHGGGYQLGFGHMVGPSYLLDRDVILVTFNYRVGLLGFLSFEDSVVPGNNGLKDQVLALHWVNKHIAAFGGDPNKVTIAGASAGGSSVQSQMLSPLSKGLFQKAISNSGSALNPWAISRTPRKTGLFIAESVGCPTNDTLVTLKCLRERTAEQLVAAVDILTKNVDYIRFPFSPVIEPPSPNAFMDQHPIDMIKSNVGSDVPALFSYAIDEGATFLSKPFFDVDNAQAHDEAWNEKTPLVASYDGLLEPDREKEVSQLLRKQFLADGKLVDNLHGFAKLIGERFFDDGIQKSCLLHAEHQKSPVYSYRFNFQRPKGVVGPLDAMFEKIKQRVSGGAMHGEDNMYIFSSSLFASIRDNSEALAMKETMIDLWFKFIEENPVANWSTVDSKLPQFTFLEITSSKPNENVFKSEETVGEQFWDSLNIPLDPPAKPKSEQKPIATHNEL